MPEPIKYGQAITIQSTFAALCQVIPMHRLDENGHARDADSFRIYLDVGHTGPKPGLQCSRIELDEGAATKLFATLGELLGKNGQNANVDDPTGVTAYVIARLAPIGEECMKFGCGRAAKFVVERPGLGEKSYCRDHAIVCITDLHY